jgi:hypothetical protein
MPPPDHRVDSDRVAVIAVHGIADQKHGDTGAAVALQLAAACGGRAQAQELPLAVPPLDPAVPYRRWRPEGWGGRGRKSLRQSWRSDFLDDAIGGMPTGSAQPNSAAPLSGGADTGVRFTDYLLAKAQGARRRHAAEPTPVSVHAVDAAALRADVFEMYWADLSRLPGSVTSIVAELFTLLFHLSRLGVDALSLAERLAGRGELTWLGRVQRGADWFYSRMLALLALQLVMCTLVLAPALVFAAHANGTRVAATVSAAVAVAAALVYLKDWRWRAALPLGVLFGAAVWTLLGTDHALLAVMLVWLVALSVVYHRFLAFCEQRFRAVLGIGWLLWAVTLLCILAFGRGAGFSGKAGWINGSLGALEAVLLAHAVLWPLLALLVTASVLLSEWALWRGKRAGRDHRQTLVTARLGLFSSVGAFLVLLMIGFLLSAWALRSLLGCELYEPWWFIDRQAALCASDFLDWRAQRNASSFALVALFLLTLLGFVALVFLPSILREMRLALPAPAGLGRWLSTGYRTIERLVRLWGVAVALGAAAVALLLLVSQLARSGVMIDPSVFGVHAQRVTDTIEQLSKNWLGTVVIGIAGGAAGLLAIGKLAIKQLQAVRAPLDAALDVDNHFREFPRDAICRVKIVERYVALLDHVRRQGYARVVIVAHSQGTVITAELLRYLQQRERLGRPAAAAGQVDVQALREWLDGIGLRLLTVGSPLRQLYALRFPALYPWVMDRVRHAAGTDWTGPQPHELGLQRWSNLWGSGDYVGRWLWAAGDGTRPAPLQVDAARYDGESQQGQDAKGRAWKDRCIGADAHTHYFELEQRLVAEELLALVR